MKHLSLVMLSALTVAVTAAHAGERISLTYEADTADTTPGKNISDCTLIVAPVKDGRNNRETIGHEFSAIEADNVTPWASAAFDRLARHGFNVVRGETPVAGSILLTPTLIRAYTFHGPMRINGIVAFDTQITLPSGRVEPRKVRAAGSKVNMAGATSEYPTALNYAINNAMDRLAQDLAPLCKPGQAVAGNVH